MKIQTTFHSAKPPAEVFSFIAENFFENHSKWDPDLLENTKLTDGPIGVGTEGRAVTKFAGKQVSNFKITQYEPNERFVFINTSGPVALERSYFFKPSQDGAEVTFIFEMLPKTLMTKLAFPILKAVTEKRVHQNIRTLETLLNS